MMNTIQEKYKESYINDMREYLRDLNQLFVDFEQESNNIELYNTIYRTVHSIKGNSAILQYNKIADLAHAIENLLDKIHQNDIVVDKSIMDILFECIDTIETMINAGEGSSSDIDTKEIFTRLDNITGGLPLKFPQKDQASPDHDPEIKLSPKELQHISDLILAGKKAFKIIVSIDKKCVLKPVKAAIVIRNLEKFGENIAVDPSKKEIKQSCPEKFCMVLVSDYDADIIKESVLYVNEISDVEIQLFDDEKHHQQFNSDSSSDPDTSQMTGPDKPSIQTVQNIRVGIDQLDSLMNRIGELVIRKIALDYVILKYDNLELTDTVEQFNRVIEELQEEITQIRMVPVDHLFSTYPRMVRDMAKNAGKSIELVIKGKDIELDRTVLDGINEPLIHLLRNAVDHGIELPQHRQSIGKPDKGIISIQARREKNQVIITMSDDGAGIRPDIIKKAAISGGLISEDNASKMNDDELISLIFLPGLSTAAVVTDISGRGVGTEIVKQDIERLGGSVRIKSVPGKVTEFKLKLPLTLAIIKALVIRVGSHLFALPFNSAIEAFDINNDRIRMIDGHETYILRDKVIPLFRLSRLLEIKRINDPDDDLFVIIVEHNNRLVGLGVDELLAQQDIVIKNIGASIGRLRGFAGATIIENGNVVLILDINSLFQGDTNIHI
jgi:two-component system chemotaxis sensor kinase CheA